MNRRGMRTVEVDENRRELSPHGTLMLPLQINHDDLSAFLGGGIICHWHEELEFSIVLQGTARYVLGKGKLQIEVLQNLDRVAPAGALLVAAWPRIEGATGLPARVLAITPKK